MSKRILIIEGGGGEGLFATGALWYLIEDLEMEFDAMFGTSIGGVIVLCLAYYYTKLGDWISSIHSLIKVLENIDKWDLIRRPSWFFFSGGYLKTKIDKTIKEKVSGDFKIGDLDIPVRVFATDINASDPVKILGAKYEISTACAMTANIPAIFSAYIDPWTKNLIFDGGCCCNDPIAYAVKYAKMYGWEDVEYIVIRLGTYKLMKKKLFNFPARILLHLFWAARTQIEKLSIKISKIKGGNFKIVDIPFELGLLDFSKKTNKEAIKKGFNYAENWYKFDNVDRG